MKHQKLELPEKVIVCEVAPRDGFQSIDEWITTENKIKVVKSLLTTGISSLEITSFVHPRAIPQLKDADELVTALQGQLNGVDVSALVPNLKGAERAAQTGIKKIKTMLSATDSHSLSNANTTSEDAQNKLSPIFEFAAQKGIEVMGSISVAFGCSFEGKVSTERLIEIIKRYEKMGVKEISLADTTGMAHPKQVYEVLGVLKEQFPQINYSMHFHNTRGMALANTVVSLQQGITRFDSAIAGLGGCPYAAGATGNVATEDLVHMLEEMGIETGIDIDKLLGAARETGNILRVPSDSYLLMAGKSSSLTEAPGSQIKKG